MDGVDDITSPELVLVSPPEVAAAARRALPDAGRLDLPVAAAATAFAVAAPRAALAPPPAPAGERPEPRFGRGGVVFTTLLTLNCLLPFLLLIAARH